MELTEEQIQKIAGLSRLELNMAERTRLAHDVNGIIHYISKLSEVDTRNAEPFFESISDPRELRNDLVSQAEGTEARERFLKNAPEKTEEYLKVKSVF